MKRPTTLIRARCCDHNNDCYRRIRRRRQAAFATTRGDDDELTIIRRRRLLSIHVSRTVEISVTMDQQQHEPKDWREQLLQQVSIRLERQEQQALRDLVDG
eukprot:CAMPEP_0194042410 /NCGR_PEP_ID=MMETSP0009_2-20130614/14186_1 /TAXON_ID=210454 /ORGANISM="Grammatophora oceanica, Strain CCMP 410" /LENGTH=100 /DNA_ID=CAMNT_0038686245 /DNA_START=701 /DNA_END=1000 /DNA_ORIENTATION=+